MLSYPVRNSRTLVTILVCLCLAALCGADARVARAQEDEEVIRVSAELVQTDVMVFDREGKFVDGLRPEQFELLVDGKPQQVVFFERIEAGTVDEDAQLAAARGGLRPNGRPTGAALPLDRGRSVVFFVDDLHVSPSSNQRARKALLRFIEEELGQNDEAAVISASGQVGFLQQFTSNKTVLRAAVARLAPRPRSSRDFQNPPMTEAHAFAIERNDTQVITYFVDAMLRETPLLRRDAAENMVISRARAIVQQSTQLASLTLRSLEGAVRGTSPLPGRKLLFFISDGFMLDARDGEIRDRLRRVTDAAARAGVVIYSMDAQGLGAGLPDASTPVAFDPGGMLTRINLSETTDMQSPLFTLASETGGRALVNTNSLSTGVSGALKETARYYLLAWKPTATEGRGGPKFQRIEVRVKDRPELHVFVRRGLYSSAPPDDESDRSEKKKEKNAAPKRPVQKLDAELQAALASPYARNALPTSLSIGYINDPAAGMVLSVTVELGREALDLLEAQSAETARVDALCVILDDKGKVAAGFKETLNHVPSNETRTRPRLSYSDMTSLRPGLYQVRVATRDRQTGRAGSAHEWVEIPDFKRREFSLSSLFLAERTSGERPSAVAVEDLAKGVFLSVDRRFARTSWLRFITFIYHAKAVAPSQPDVALQVQVLRDDQPVFTAPLAKVSTEGLTDFTRVPYAAELTLDHLPAGKYVLQVTAIDRVARASASQSIDFTIE